MIFSPRKIFLSDDEIIPSKVITHKIETSDVTLQNKLHHFQMSEKPKTANLINVIHYGTNVSLV